MNPIVQHFISVFEGMSGKTSSMRLIMIVWGAGVPVVWAIQSFRTEGHSLVDIPENVLWAMAAVIGGKVFQRFKEGKDAREKVDQKGDQTTGGTAQ